MSTLTIADLQTPFLVVDQARMTQNVSRLTERLRALGVGLRPHVKTAKSVAAVNQLFGGRTGPITVSTLAEAVRFADAGYVDMIYAVGIAPDKVPRVMDLLDQGVDIAVLVDSPQQVEAIDRFSTSGLSVPMLIEIDCDGHRGGLRPDSSRLLNLGEMVADVGQLRGVLTHAGESYFARIPEALAAAAENERHSAVYAADRLREHGLQCSVVSVGSTPTAHAFQRANGVTEVRAGNFVFFDLVMAGIGVCSVDDIALFVVATVIGHQTDRGWILTDAGWTALSSDRGTSSQAVDHGYGLVAALDGTIYDGLIVSHATQEHGILSMRSCTDSPPDIPIGTRLRILPNHACSTAAQHDEYKVINVAQRAVSGDLPPVDAIWSRVRGW